MAVYECCGNKVLYKALKVVFKLEDGNYFELIPWPTLDHSSTERCEQMQDVEPRFVTFFEQMDVEIGEKFNKVRITDTNNENEIKKVELLWAERP